MSRQTLIVLFSIVALVLTSVVGAWSVEKNLSTDLNNLTQASSRGKIIVVPKDFASIQSAINAANDGDIVFVDSGTYYENIVLNKSISLLGAGYSETIVDANRTSHVITVSSSNAVVAGFTFLNGGFPIPAYCGVKIDNVDNVTVSDNFVSGNFIGIRLGDLQRGSNGNIVRNNIITKNRYGIFADHTNETLFYGNVVTENNWNGIEIAYSGRNTLQANNISYNMAYGLEIVSNTPSLYNRIFHNNFVNNKLKVSVSNLPQIWDDGYPSGGNYWSDYTGVDSDYDGIGDSWYEIDSDNVDHYPLMGMFSSFNTSYGYAVDFISNSSISHFNSSLSGPSQASLVFNVTGATGIQGFCRVCIPKALIDGSYVVRFNGEVITNLTYLQVRELPCSNETYEYLYVNYTHSGHTIEISGTTTIPEFSPFHILLLFMVATLPAVIVYRRKRTI